MYDAHHQDHLVDGSRPSARGSTWGRLGRPGPGEPRGRGSCRRRAGAGASTRRTAAMAENVPGVVGKRVLHQLLSERETARPIFLDAHRPPLRRTSRWSRQGENRGAHRYRAHAPSRRSRTGRTSGQVTANIAAQANSPSSPSPRIRAHSTPQAHPSTTRIASMRLSSIGLLAPIDDVVRQAGSTAVEIHPSTSTSPAAGGTPPSTDQTRDVLDIERRRQDDQVGGSGTDGLISDVNTVDGLRVAGRRGVHDRIVPSGRSRAATQDPLHQLTRISSHVGGDRPRGGRRDASLPMGRACPARRGRAARTRPARRLWLPSRLARAPAPARSGTPRRPSKYESVKDPFVPTASTAFPSRYGPSTRATRIGSRGSITSPRKPLDAQPGDQGRREARTSTTGHRPRPGATPLLLGAGSGGTSADPGRVVARRRRARDRTAGRRQPRPSLQRRTMERDQAAASCGRRRQPDGGRAAAFSGATWSAKRRASVLMRRISAWTAWGPSAIFLEQPSCSSSGRPAPASRRPAAACGGEHHARTCHVDEGERKRRQHDGPGEARPNEGPNEPAAELTPGASLTRCSMIGDGVNCSLELERPNARSRDRRPDSGPSRRGARRDRDQHDIPNSKEREPPADDPAGRRVPPSSPRAPRPRTS